MPEAEQTFKVIQSPGFGRHKFQSPVEHVRFESR